MSVEQFMGSLESHEERKRRHTNEEVGEIVLHAKSSSQNQEELTKNESKKNVEVEKEEIKFYNEKGYRDQNFLQDLQKD